MSKHKVLNLGQNIPRWPYHFTEDLLEGISDKKDLRVIVNDKLNFHSHTWAQVAWANQAPGLIKQTYTTRKLCVVKKLYKAQQELGMILASPCYKMNLKALRCPKASNKAHTSFARQTVWETPCVFQAPYLCLSKEERRCNCYLKLLRNNLSRQVFSLSLASTTRGHTKKLQVSCCHGHECQQFFVCTIPH